jgi:hypothetical protein
MSAIEQARADLAMQISLLAEQNSLAFRPSPTTLTGEFFETARKPRFPNLSRDKAPDRYQVGWHFKGGP